MSSSSSEAALAVYFATFMIFMAITGGALNIALSIRDVDCTCQGAQ